MKGPLVGLAVLAPTAAGAHDAFGDLGPFYANALHPLADPAQGVLLLGAALLMALQPIEAVRSAYAALVIGGVAGAGAAVFAGAGPLPLVVFAALVCALGAGAIAGRAMPGALATPLAGAAGLAAGLLLTTGSDPRDMALGLMGGALGVIVPPLLAWGALERIVQQTGPLAAAVAGSWIAAVGIMVAALSA